MVYLLPRLCEARRRACCKYLRLRFAQRSGYSPIPGRKFAGSSVAPLAICWRSDFPPLFQRLADLGLAEVLLLRKIFTRVAWLTVLRNKLRRLNVLRFPIEIENLVVWSQIILGVSMAIQAPRHAVRLRDVNH
jgi:hypothetical protein